MKKVYVLLAVLCIAAQSGEAVSMTNMEIKKALIMAISLEEGVPPEFAVAIALTENWTLNPRAVSPPNRNGTRDWGLMQLNDAYFPLSNWYCAETNARTAIRHIRWLMDHPRTCTFWSVAVAYNAGIKRLNRPPNSTLTYAENVMRKFNELSGGRAPVLIGRH